MLPAFRSKQLAAAKRSETELVQVIWTDLESVIQGVKEVREKKRILHSKAYMWDLENGTDESLCRTETEMQTGRAGLWTQQGRGRWGGSGD